MIRRWQEVVESSGVHLCTYVFEKFGPANALLLEYSNGRCAIISPPPTPDPTLIEYAKSKGEIDALIVSNLGHTAGYKDWQTIVPEARLYATSDCIPLLKRLKPVDVFMPVSDLEFRSGMECFGAPGTRTGSLLMRSRLGERPVVFVDEILMNLNEPIKPLFMRFMFALTRTRTGLSLNNVFRLFLTSDRKKLTEAARTLLEDGPICIPAHGDPISDTDLLQRARTLLA